MATWGWDEAFQRGYFDEHFDHRKHQIIQVGGRDAGFLSFESRPVAALAMLVGLGQGLEPAPASAQATTAPIEAVIIHPPVAVPFQRSEHALGAEDHVPDALGADCVVVRRNGGPVRAGEPVARIGNNGSSFHPHVHVGAFRGDMMSEDAVPLQIRIDLEAMGRLRGTVGN